MIFPLPFCVWCVYFLRYLKIVCSQVCFSTSTMFTFAITNSISIGHFTPTTAAEHFLTAPNHTANDMQLIPIEKVHSKRDSVRKAREAFLISKGRTIDPHGLNIREETYKYFFLSLCYIFYLISPYVICFTIIFMLSILIYVVPLLRKYFLPHIYEHVPSVISHFT